MHGSLEEPQPGAAPSVDAENPFNTGVLAYLRRRNERGRPLCEPPDAVPDPFLSLGSHPDIVERVWSGLGDASSDCHPCIVLGTPALATGSTGVVLAVALGTSYALRLPSAADAHALDGGRRLRHRYGRDGPTLDLPASFGEAWVFGAFDEGERTWLRETAAGVS